MAINSLQLLHIHTADFGFGSPWFFDSQAWYYNRVDIYLFFFFFFFFFFIFFLIWVYFSFLSYLRWWSWPITFRVWWSWGGVGWGSTGQLIFSFLAFFVLSSYDNEIIIHFPSLPTIANNLSIIHNKWVGCLSDLWMWPDETIFLYRQ